MTLDVFFFNSLYSFSSTTFSNVKRTMSKSHMFHVSSLSHTPFCRYGIQMNLSKNSPPPRLTSSPLILLLLKKGTNNPQSHPILHHHHDDPVPPLSWQQHP
mmetsp:Transcript_15826/g.21720  ORF Transcript_15826/g.21720 Transcript_15826/m.21720 type:complete len:101 (-) Transcript_15826:1009-1311(-)